MTQGNAELDRGTFRRLADPIKRYFVDLGMDELDAGVTAANILTSMTPAIQTFVAAQKLEARKETEKAFGGCKKCYGKGYATVRSGLIGYEDFGGDGFKTPPTNKIKYCTCDRGTQLQTLNQKEKTR